MPALGMASAVRLALSAIVALPLIACGALAGPASQGERLALRFEVFGALGLHVVTSRTKIEEIGDRYAITSDLSTNGLAGLVVTLAGHSEVRGRFTAAAAYPEMYREDRSRNGNERRSRVDYPPDGAVIGSSTPPPPDPVTPAEARGTVDNLTAYFLVERQLAREGQCALAVPVFDGRHRYDLDFANVGRQVLAPAGGQNFSGPTIVCRMTRVEIAGFGSETGEGVQRGTIWYARLVPGDLLVPVRMQLVTEIGAVDVYLAELHGRGVDLKLME